MKQLNFPIFKMKKMHKIKFFKNESKGLLEKFVLLMKIKLKDLENLKINKNIYKEFLVRRILLNNFIIAYFYNNF